MMRGYAIIIECGWMDEHTNWGRECARLINWSRVVLVRPSNILITFNGLLFDEDNDDSDDGDNDDDGIVLLGNGWIFLIIRLLNLRLAFSTLPTFDGNDVTNVIIIMVANIIIIPHDGTLNDLFFGRVRLRYHLLKV
jgi:hypothetical protein